MKIKRPVLIAVLVTPLLLAILGVGGYFVWQAMHMQQSENEAILQKFGFEIMPANPYTESEGVLGQKQLPATFAEDNLTPVEKVIHGLMQDREQLLKDNAALQQEIEQLQQQVAELERYRDTNELLAPETLAQELARTRTELETALRALPEAQRFSKFWIQMMSGAALSEYRRFLEANRLMIDAPTRKQLMENDLINYAFCIGNAVELAANSADEVRSIADWLEQPGTTRLSTALQEDLNTVLPPCQAPLRKMFNARLAGMNG